MDGVALVQLGWPRQKKKRDKPTQICACASILSTTPSVTGVSATRLCRGLTLAYEVKIRAHSGITGITG